MVAAAAALAVVGGIGVNSLRPTPAFAVSDEGNGDTVVTIHRLDDAAGLESELAKHGIDADVNYGGSLENGPVEDHDGGVTVLPSDADPGQVGGAHWRVPAGAEEQLSSAAAEAGPQVGAGQVGPGQAGDDPCGFTGNDEAPFTTREVGSDYVITIPKDSVIRDQTLTITTFEGANNELGLITSFSAGDNTQCGVVGN